MSTPAKFVHLHTHSHYSLLDGLAKIDDLLSEAKKYGMESLAITDHGNIYGAIEFYKKAKKAGIRPILGIEAYVAPESRLDREAKHDERYYHMILLCQNETGWKNLLQLITKANFEGYYYKPRIDKELMRQHHEGIIATSGCISGEVCRFLLKNRYAEAKKAALEYEEIFGKGNFFLEIGMHHNVPDVARAQEGLTRIRKETGISFVATQDIHYACKDDAETHDVLLAVQTGNKLSDPDRLSLKDDDFSMRSSEEMAELFKNFEFGEEAIANTAAIAERCNLEIKLGEIHIPKFKTPEGISANEYFHTLIKERMPRRYPNITPEIETRLAYELGIIEKMGFIDYFLVVQDFVNWAKDHGIMVGPGRGSAAGSIISYILGITDLDPLRYNLLFERFLNPERIAMPDIDVDFTDKRRDEVLAYVREKYGENNVAQIITFGTMAARAAIRDAGRAMGLTYGFCDQLAKLVPALPHTVLAEAIKTVPELTEMHKNNPDAKKLLDTACRLEGVARHASVHACAVVISERPLVNYLALQRAPQDDSVTITQFEMHTIEDLGLLKMDFLGLKNLTIIEETTRLVKELHGTRIDISKIPLDDPKTFAILRMADTTGVFQFESSGMRRYMKEIKPTEIEDLIALVALYRPGPMELIPTYIKRKHGQEPVSYLHPKLEPILSKTYGVIVYQEQVMDMATEIAGLTKGQGYLLIKAVGKKIKSLLDEQKEKFINGCLTNNIPPAVAQKIWELIEPFARYGFNKAHSACYALIGYETAYLRANYPIEFMTALFNADSDDTDRIAFLVGEAQKSDIKILPPDINKSGVDFMPDGPNIRFGLLAIKNVGENIVKAIVEDRSRNGEFASLSDFLNRIHHKDLNKKSLESLVKGGAFDSFGIERNQALSNIEDILKFSADVRRVKTEFQNSLFGTPTIQKTLTLKPATPATSAEKLQWEKELLGLYISDHPLNNFKELLGKTSTKKIKEVTIPANDGARVQTAGVLSSIKKHVTKNGQPMLFAKIEDMDGAVELIVFSDTLQKNPALWTENKVIIVAGRMSWRNDEPKLICEAAKELTLSTPQQTANPLA